MAKEILFCGYGKLGLECLKKLEKEGHQIKYILTHLDKSENGVDTYAIKKGYEYSYKDTRKHIDEFKEIFKSYGNKLLISINYRFILPKEILSLLENAINIHGSLLPKYRGRTPHVWSIINGEKTSGITCHLIDEGVDTGDIITQIEVPISQEDTGYSLLKKYEEKYPDILIKSLKKLEENYKLIKQDETKASYFGKRIPEMGYIDFYQSFIKIRNFIRAQTKPYPGAYYFLPNGKKIIIYKIKETNEIKIDEIGKIVEYDSRKFVGCVDKIIEIVEYDLD
ncbi:MAG: methionyl-tRNA formyltransferase [Cetobacterium sp.]